MIIERFGDFVFNHYDAEDRLDTAPAGRTFLELPDGSGYDLDRGAERAGKSRPITRRFVVIADTAEELDDAVDAVLALSGVYDRLVVRRANGEVRWCYAACEQVTRTVAPRTPISQELEISWLAPIPGWNGAYHGAIYFDDGEYFDDGLYFDSASTTILAGSPQMIYVTNSGNLTATNALITITAGSAALTAFSYVCGLCAMNFSGTIAAGESLVIDCGAKTVLNDGADAFADFDPDPGNHKSGEWLALAAGSNTVTVVYVGGGTGSTIALEFMDRWK